MIQYTAQKLPHNPETLHGLHCPSELNFLNSINSGIDKWRLALIALILLTLSVGSGEWGFLSVDTMRGSQWRLNIRRFSGCALVGMDLNCAVVLNPISPRSSFAYSKVFLGKSGLQFLRLWNHTFHNNHLQINCWLVWANCVCCQWCWWVANSANTRVWLVYSVQ